MTQKQRERAALAIYDALTPDNRRQLTEIMKQLAAQQERQRAAILQAINNATCEQVKHGASIMADAIMKYRDDVWTLAGLAYTAGIAEGKQQERARRRHARAIKAAREAARAAQLAAKE